MQFYHWLVNDKTMVRGGYSPKKTEKRGASQKYASSLVGAIRSFYRVNGFPVVIDRGLIPTAVPRKENRKRDLSIEDIKHLVDHAPNLRDKAVILMMFQGGFDVSTLCSLDYGDVARGLDNDECPLAIEVVRKKRNIAYTTFIGRDAIDALNAYLIHRRQREGPLSLDEPLFVKERATNGSEDRDRLTPDVVECMLRVVALESGVVTPEEMKRAYFNPCRPHALRSAFATLLQLDGVSEAITDYWQGHKKNYDGAYFIPPKAKLQELYAQHMQALSVNRAVEEVKQLEQKFDVKMESYDDLINRQAAKIKELEGILSKMELSKEQQLGKEFIKALKNPLVAQDIIAALEQVLRLNIERTSDSG
ncbi:MAG: tyrosine-type recombinase/integrase [Thermoplasmatota archaeon]